VGVAELGDADLEEMWAQSVEKEWAEKEQGWLGVQTEDEPWDQEQEERDVKADAQRKMDEYGLDYMKWAGKEEVLELPPPWMCGPPTLTGNGRTNGRINMMTFGSRCIEQLQSGYGLILGLPPLVVSKLLLAFPLSLDLDAPPKMLYSSYLGRVQLVSSSLLILWIEL
jgi:hypothetical protein